MKVFIITLLALVATLTSGLPQFPLSSSLLGSGDSLFSSPQSVPPGYYHNDASQAQAARASQGNARTAQGSHGSNMNATHAEGLQSSRTKFNGLISKNKGNSSSAGAKYYQSESFGELWDDKVQWDETLAATEATMSKDSYQHVDTVKAEEGEEGSMSEVAVAEGDSVDIRNSHTEGRQQKQG